jgi:hypothetical protein
MGKLVLLFLITLNVSAQTASSGLVGALDQSEQESHPLVEENATIDEVEQVEVSNTTPTYQCNSSDQTSLPLKHFEALLRNGNKGIDINHNEESGVLELSGSKNMVGNCYSMLEPKLTKPNSILPWVFQVQFKSCGQAKCSYDVQVLENGSIKTVAGKQYEPSFDGFMSCLKDTGVYQNGRIIEDKVVKKTFYQEFTGVNTTDDFLYASNGPLAIQDGLRYSSQNEIPGQKCFVFERIQKQPKKLYSLEDYKKQQKYEYFQEVCKSQNWKLIDEKIGDFEQFKSLEAILVKVRNQLIEKDVSKLAMRLDDEKDYREISDEDISLIDAFKEKVIDHETDKINKLYRKYIDSSGSDKESIKEELQKKVLALKKYSQSPFLQVKHLEMLQYSKTRNAPMEREQWIKSTKNLAHILETVYEYQGLGKKDDEDRTISPKVVGSNVNKKMAEFNKNLSIGITRHKIRNNIIKEDLSKTYANLSSSYDKTIQKRLSELQRQIQEEMQYSQTMCPRLGNQIMVQSCIQDSMEVIKQCQVQAQQIVAELEKRKKAAEVKARKYKSDEEYRNSRYGSSGSTSSTSSVEEETDNSYVFNYPGASQNQIRSQLYNTAGQAGQIFANSQMPPWQHQAMQQGANWGQSGWPGYNPYTYMDPRTQQTPGIFPQNMPVPGFNPYFNQNMGGLGGFYNFNYNGGFGMNPGMGGSPWLRQPAGGFNLQTGSPYFNN